MARNVKTQGSLRFRDSQTESRTERADRKTDTILSVTAQQSRDLPPFQRVKLGTDCFLAVEVIPLRSCLN